MVKKLLVGLLLVLVIASTLLASCTSNTTSSTSTSTPQGTTSAQSSTTTQTSTPATTSAATQANWWDKFGVPQYGGEVTAWSNQTVGGSWDPNAGRGLGAGAGTNLQLEILYTFDRALDRSIWAYNTGFTPLEYMEGALAESWEQADLSTVVLHIRKGVYWQNIPPVNGREFTAQDVQYSFDRTLGTGSGFTEPNPFRAGSYGAVASITATDQYTVQIKLKQPGVVGLYQVLTGNLGFVPPEWDQQADPSDWKSAVGTGAWMLTDFQVGTSATYSKNPNYWGYDARYPQNKLPYIDTFKQVAIPDVTTAIAALRTAKIDLMIETFGLLTMQQQQTLAKTNPDIQQAVIPGPAAVLSLRCDTKPFTDIKVRKALQMAINLPAIAKSFYVGTVNGDPVGLISPAITGWATPYAQWPVELQQEYTYNPTKAKQLLADAGYPDGFETNVFAPTGSYIPLLEIVKSEFADIGVNMTINVMDKPTLNALVSAGKEDQMSFDSGQMGSTGPVMDAINRRLTNSGENHTYNNDPAYDALVNKVNTAATTADMQKSAVAADMYSLQQHWSVNFCNTHQPLVWQSWVKGYSGEYGMFSSAKFYGLWIDQSLKK